MYIIDRTHLTIKPMRKPMRKPNGEPAEYALCASEMKNKIRTSSHFEMSKFCWFHDGVIALHRQQYTKHYIYSASHRKVSVQNQNHLVQLSATLLLSSIKSTELW